MSNTPARKRSAVPASRVGRLMRFGMLSGELALSTALGAAKQFTSGKRTDIAAAVLFLTSPAAAWITGQTLPVDGGFTTGMN